MRRKSERTATKKAKSSPEKKVEKAKRTRTRRQKQSSSSENESGDDSSPVRTVVPVVEEEAAKKPPTTTTPVKEDSPEEAQSVWHVKETDSSGSVGEIKKLKICLARPPSTPERVDRSPRSKRKHSRATSSSDTASVEPVEDRRKSRRSKRTARESKDDSDKNHDSHGEEPDTETDQQPAEKLDNEISQSTESHKETVSEETPMSTTNEEVKNDENEKSVDSTANEDVPQNKESKQEIEVQSKSSDADTTVASPGPESKDSHSETNAEKDTPSQVNIEKGSPSKIETDKESNNDKEDQSEKDTKIESKSESNTEKESRSETNKETDGRSEENTPERKSRERSVSLEKSEVLEIHAEETKCESSALELTKVEDDFTEEQKKSRDDKEASRERQEVSIHEEKTNKSVSKKTESARKDKVKTTNEPDVVESSVTVEKGRMRNVSTDSEKDKDVEGHNERYRSKDFDRSDSTQSAQEETIHNGQVGTPIVVSRKRRWGSRTSKLTTQKSITISTDILKEIIPDVKPVEFDEVIEEKKVHKRVEVTEKVERPVLPKIVIDNTENVEQHKKENEDKNKENVKARESNLAMNRKISIVRDIDTVIRPPSPPRYKQSNILYITNLVRPFTLPQLKNLLQRTGRIAENGFWIDKIKSKCFVRYETEDQAVETRHALHGVTWPVSNPKTLQVDFSNQEAFDKAKLNEDTDNAQASTIPGTVEDWLREQDMKRERGDVDKPWERKAVMREWDVGKNDKEKEKDKLRKDDRPLDKRRHRTPERSPEPAKKFKKKEEEAPAKLLDDLFRKTKATPCIYWLPLSAETIAIKEEQRRQHMAEHERRLQELRRTQHRRH